MGPRQGAVGSSDSQPVGQRLCQPRARSALVTDLPWSAPPGEEHTRKPTAMVLGDAAEDKGPRLQQSVTGVGTDGKGLKGLLGKGRGWMSMPFSRSRGRRG